MMSERSNFHGSPCESPLALTSTKWRTLQQKSDDGDVKDFYDLIDAIVNHLDWDTTEVRKGMFMMGLDLI